MARKPEAQYTATVGKLLPPSVYALKLSLPYTAGVPDSWYSGPAGDLWVEWKYLQTIPPSIDCTRLLTALQAQWLRSRHAEGRNVAVIVGSKKGGVIFPSLTWETPISRDEFLSRAMSKKELAAYLTECTSQTDYKSTAKSVNKTGCTCSCGCAHQ
jgi:hypothetical protein